MKIYRPGKEKGTYKVLTVDGLFLTVIEGEAGKGQTRMTFKLTPEEAAALSIFLRKMAEAALIEDFKARMKERKERVQRKNSYSESSGNIEPKWDDDEGIKELL